MAWDELSSRNLRSAIKPIALGAALIVAAISASAVSWMIDVATHTWLEAMAAAMAVFVATIAFARFGAHGTSSALFLGVAFAATAVMDAFHAIATSEPLVGRLPSALSDLVPWTWVASRIVFSMLLLFSVLAIGRRTKPRRLASMVGGTMVVAFVMWGFASFPLPTAISEGVLARPQELVAGLAFVVALGIVLRRGAWINGGLDRWLVYALVASVVTQVAVMPVSGAIFDATFTVAHIGKIISYAFVLAGLLADVYAAFTEADCRRAELAAANDRLEDLLRSKNDFLATISHELRTPLTAVLGFVDVLRDPAGMVQSNERGAMLEAVAEQGHDLINIVEDLLVAARDDLGELHLASVPVNLTAQARQVVEALPVGRERVEIVVDDAVHAKGDPTRVRQIIRNLLVNAVRYGGDHIQVAAHTVNGQAFLEVRDDGTGVPPDKEASLFVPYESAHSSPGLTDSVGIGLAVSRKLAERMDGSLTYSRRAGWTRFTLSLYTAPANTEGAVPTPFLRGVGVGG